MSFASTGLRPSEQIALVVSDYNAARGVLSVTKARVVGIDAIAGMIGDEVMRSDQWRSRTLFDAVRCGVRKIKFARSHEFD